MKLLILRYLLVSFVIYALEIAIIFSGISYNMLLLSLMIMVLSILSIKYILSFFNLIWVKVKLLLMPMFKFFKSYFWKIIIYLSFAFLAAISSFLMVFKLSNNNVANVISILIQSEATIIVIVITLSMVVVQQTVSAYSIRMIDIFKSPKTNPDFFIVLTVYILAIIFGMLTLDQLSTDKSIENLPLILMWITYSLGVFALLILAPYFVYTLNLLKPSKIIEILSLQINKENINSIKNINTQKDAKQTQGDDDPILPIIDLVTASLIKYDYETAKAGLKSIIKHTNVIINEESVEKEFVEKLQISLISYFERIGRLAIDKYDQESTFEVINSLSIFGQKSAQNKPKITIKTRISDQDSNEVLYEVEGLKLEVVDVAVPAITNLGKLTVKQKMEYQTKNVILALTYIGKSAVKNKFRKPIEDTLRSLEQIGNEAIDEQSKNTEMLVVHYFREIVNEALRQQEDAASVIDEFELTILVAAQSLENIGLRSLDQIRVHSLRQTMESTTSYVLISLNMIADDLLSSLLIVKDKVITLKETNEKRHPQDKIDKITNLIVESEAATIAASIGVIGIAAAKIKINTLSNQAHSDLSQILLKIIKHGFIANVSKDEIEDTINFLIENKLGVIGKIVAEQNKDILTTNIVNNLNDIGIVLVENEMKDTARNIILLLQDIGICAAKNQMGSSVVKVIKSILDIHYTAQQCTNTDFINFVYNDNLHRNVFENIIQEAHDHHLDESVKEIKELLDPYGTDFLDLWNKIDL